MASRMRPRVEKLEREFAQREAEKRQSPMFSRGLPTGKSMAGRALARLIQGDRLTHRGFDRATHTYRLSVHVEILRNRYGWDIADLWLNAPTADPGRRARFKEYFLDPATLATLTPQEREWARIVWAAERSRPAA